MPAFADRDQSMRRCRRRGRALWCADLRPRLAGWPLQILGRLQVAATPARPGLIPRQLSAIGMAVSSGAATPLLPYRLPSSPTTSVTTLPPRHLLRLVFSSYLLCCCCFLLCSSSSPRVVASDPLPHQSLLAAGRLNSADDDRRALLTFKSMVRSDPPGALDSWNETSGQGLCSAWRGVICGGRRHPDRVTGLDLQSLGLSGTIPAAPLTNVTFLRRIHLGGNQFHGNVAPELGSLSRLQHLNLTRNALAGGIPAALAGLGRNLVTLDLSGNALTGGIPPWLGNFSSLAHLRLSNNIALGGTIPASLAGIPTLQILHLSTNGLRGGIPPALGNLAALTILSLSNNSLSGPIPPSLGNLTSLRSLRLNRNGLEGPIPPSLCHLPSLAVLDAAVNNLTGVIPPSIGNLSSSIQVLSLTGNNLVGPIPTAVRRLSSLTFFVVAQNRLEGTISHTLYNLSASISTLDLRGNRFSGTLAADLGGGLLPNLEKFSLGENQIHGPIPSSLCNATGIGNLQLDSNSFTGPVPPCLGNLGGLQRLTLFQNRLEARDAKDWSFLTSLANCTHLEALGLQNNNFGGVLPPNSISNLSRELDKFALGQNRIAGRIPEGIGNLVGLSVLSMSDNLFVGPIPASIGRLRKLVVLDLSRNRLSGPIPSSAVSNLTQLAALLLGENNLGGSIPPALGTNMQNLQELVLSHNQLDGFIPKEVVSIRFLSKVLDLSHNSLTGPLPPEIGRLENVNSIDLSGNNLTGGIPATISRCQILESLYLQGNALDGSIPPALGELKGIRRVDLSRNRLTGNIPEFLAELHSLEYLNLSFNHLQGMVPEGGAFRNSGAVVLAGNGELCAASLVVRSTFRLPACPADDPHAPIRRGANSRHAMLLKVFIPLSAVVLLLMAAVLFWYLVFTRRLSRSKNGTARADPAAAPSMDQLVGNTRLSYADLFKATDGFSPRNLVGVGSFGSVYRADMGHDAAAAGGGKRFLAVKVINLQQRGASKSFMAECEALRNVRHRNLLKILTSCSSIDHTGDSFKALVFEYMANGSLDDWLHPAAADRGEHDISSHGRRACLSVTQRLGIAIDVASALQYLHVGAHRRIIHCDLKPSNVLLDDDMTAHVGDFGLARFLVTSTADHTSSRPSSATPSSSSAVRGTVGYAAPEYGMGCKPSTEGDVYSYGILLLEMITGRRPTDAMFKEELTLRKFVETSFPARALDVVDEKLLPPPQVEEEGAVVDGSGGDAGGGELGGAGEYCLVSMLSVALRCSEESPRERMTMEDVVKEMTATREVVFRMMIQAGGRHGKRSGNGVHTQ